MGTKKRAEHFLGITSTMGRRERGQILVLVALAMVGLLAATGIAVDTGFIMLRKSQFDRAVDAAALTGVTVVSPTDASTLGVANLRGRQILGANGIIINSDDACNPDGTIPETVQYCGERSNGMMPGSVSYRVVARWNVPLFFMPLIGFNNVSLTSDAIAEYFPLVDMYASDIGEQGLVRAALLSIFGPSSCTGNGDAYTPQSRSSAGINAPWYSELNGVYTYRVAIPADYPFEKVRIELFDPDTFNSSSVTDTATNTVYDLNGNSVTRGGTNCTNPDNRAWPCLWTTGDTADTNPNWFARVDEARGGPGVTGCNTLVHSDTSLTRTYFRLFYYEQVSSGSLQEVDLAYYIGENSTNPTEAGATDKKWVSPGATCPGGATPAYSDPACELMPPFNRTGTPTYPDLLPSSVGEPRTTTSIATCNTLRTTADLNGGGFRSNAPNPCVGDGNFTVRLKDVAGEGSSEVPNIYTDPGVNTPTYLYLQVIGFSGSSENGFGIWAGPPRVNSAAVAGELIAPIEAPANVNARQVYMLRNYSEAPDAPLHSSHGVVVYGMGHMNMNWTGGERVRFPLAYLNSTFSGLKLKVEVFDTAEANATDSPPLYFYFDTIATKDWAACYSDNGISDCRKEEPPSGDPDNPQYPDAPDFSYKECFMPPDPLYGGASTGGDCLGGPGTHPDMQDRWGILEFTVPTELDEVLLERVPFYGGRLYVSYKGRAQETNSWKMTVDARPVLTG